MVSICMEYVEDRADKVYVYGSCEEGIIASSFFYDINSKIVERHKLNDAILNGENDTNFSYDVSVERQKAVMKIINENIREMIKLCKKYDRDMPTEMKLIYDVKNGDFKANYKYELVYTNHDTKTARKVANEWFEEIKNNNL
ncbi:immunity protein YezG family protein [Bacillus changyiensis]|uniref:immunity protein YezG family protein n=1 Tax=Bacillus changyiensis TaxID=3004103 RepID=UPI0022E8F3C2|nr:immunity protein YezG family protein [Bacillus changyiensis]MDA1476425.1 DUF600 family protein [Bacillus changyiensis]